MVSFVLSELDMQQILKTLTTLSYVRRKATNILLLYNTHIGVFCLIKMVLKLKASTGPVIFSLCVSENWGEVEVVW